MIRRPVVLMHHGFTVAPRHDDPENLFVTVAALEQQLDLLARGGWSPLDLDGFLAARDGSAGGRSFLLTVDDGFDSVARLAAPVLATRGVPWVLFVPASLVGATATWLPRPVSEPLVDAAQLRALVAEGVEIGVHGADHRLLVGLDQHELHRQVVSAREALADACGVLPRAFAYPYGAFDAAAVEAVRGAGYAVGFSVFRDAGPWAVSRVDVHARDTGASMRAKLVPAYRPLWRAAAPVRRARRALLPPPASPPEPQRAGSP